MKRTIPLLIILLSIVSVFAENNLPKKLMSLTDLNVRTSPDLSAGVVAVIPAKTEMTLITEQGDVIGISGFRGRWSEVIVNAQIKGWVFGGLCVPYCGQNMDDMIERFEFTKYILERPSWWCRLSEETTLFVSFSISGDTKYFLNPEYGAMGFRDVGIGVGFGGYVKYVKRADGGYDFYTDGKLRASFVIQNDVLTVLYVEDKTQTASNGSFRSTVVLGKKFIPYRPGIPIQ